LASLVLPHYYVLVESEDYRDQREKYGQAKDIDEALRGVLWSITIRPDVWPVVPGFKKIRIAYTDPIAAFRVRGRQRPGVRVWFEIRDSDTVDLLYLDLDSESE
jgi:hypothetical protein